MTIEEEKKLRETALKKEYTDEDCAVLLKDTYDWFKDWFAKMPDFSKEKHDYKLTALKKIAEKFGAKFEAKRAKKEDDEEE